MHFVCSFVCESLHTIHWNRCSDSLLNIAVELRTHSIFVECIRMYTKTVVFGFVMHSVFSLAISLRLFSPFTSRPLKWSKMDFILKPEQANGQHNIECIWSRIFRCARYSVSHKTKLNAALIPRAAFFCCSSRLSLLCHRYGILTCARAH